MWIWPVILLLAAGIPLARGVPASGISILADGALLAFLAALAITPWITLTGRVSCQRLRWWYGSWAAWLSLVLLVLVASVPTPGGMACSLSCTAAPWTGTLAAGLTLPMLVTSNKLSQRQLGAYWKRLQRILMYSLWVLIAVHLIALRLWALTDAYILASVPLAMLRLPAIRKKLVGRRRSGDYPYSVLALSGLLYGTGMLLIALREVLVVFHAIHLRGPPPQAAHVASAQAQANLCGESRMGADLDTPGRRFVAGRHPNDPERRAAVHNTEVNSCNYSTAGGTRLGAGASLSARLARQRCPPSPCS
jgi:DMSO/TMAO reductase YedYZ heme-binding membrane subunit